MTTNPTPIALGSYLAKHCPQRVAFDYDPTMDKTLQDPPTDAAQQRMDAGVAFEAAVGQMLMAANPLTVCIPADEPADEREKLTATAMSIGAELIWNGRLPRDDAGRRVGDPDLLVRGPHRPDGNYTYRPVDVKWHAARPGKGKHVVKVSTLDKPRFVNARRFTDMGKSRTDDDLQLAHYLRMLQACGHGPARNDKMLAGIIGRDGLLYWVDLSEQDRRLTVNGTAKKASMMDVYDHEFAVRLDIVDRAMARQPGDPEIIEHCPRWSDCKQSCPWRTVAHQRLQAADALILLPGMTAAIAGKLADAGITSRAQLAALTPSGLSQVAATTGVKSLAAHAESAQATTTGQVLARTGFTWFPTADGTTRWLDVDMENDPDNGIIYMWGTRTPDGYTAFVDWTGSDEGEAKAFVDYWQHLTDELSAGTIAYCYTSAEARCMRHLAEKHAGKPGVPDLDTVEALLACDQWYDLYDFVKGCAWPTESHSIKAIAKICGFSWRDTDPSGEASVLWYRTARGIGALDEPTRKQAQQRILEYNEDDVKAMEAIRDFTTTLIAA